MFTLRYVTAGDPQKPVNCKDRKFDTKRELLAAIAATFSGNTRGASMNKTRITRINQLYIFEVPKP